MLVLLWPRKESLRVPVRADPIDTGACGTWEINGSELAIAQQEAVAPLAHFVVGLGVGDWKAAVQLGLWVWVGFQAMLLMGAVLHEKMPWMLYSIRAGDAFVKTLLMTVILGVWRR